MACREDGNAKSGHGAAGASREVPGNTNRASATANETAAASGYILPTIPQCTALSASVAGIAIAFSPLSPIQNTLWAKSSSPFEKQQALLFSNCEIAICADGCRSGRRAS
jgi:hypothetical protein